MKRILLAALLSTTSAAAYAQPEEFRYNYHETRTSGPAQHLTVQDSPLSPVIIKKVKPGSDDDETWGLSAPPGTSLSADINAKIREIAAKEKIVKTVLTQLAPGSEPEQLFAQDACKLSAEAGTVYHAAFRNLHATVTRGTGTGEFRAYPAQRDLDIAARRYTRAIRECLRAASAKVDETQYDCSYSVCTIVPPDEPAPKTTTEREVLPCAIAPKTDPVCQVSP